MTILKNINVLSYYDGIQIIEAWNDPEYPYIGVYIAEPNKFLVVQSPPARCQLFERGLNSLSHVIKKRLQGIWHIGTLHSATNIIELQPGNKTEIPKEYLPEEGFYLK